jgi:hypothetical protein
VTWSMLKGVRYGCCPRRLCCLSVATSGPNPSAQRPGIFLAYHKSIPQTAICFQWREA